jgi:hypothetical protein
LPDRGADVYLAIPPDVAADLLYLEGQQVFDGLPPSSLGSARPDPALPASSGELAEDECVVRRMKPLPENRAVLEDMLGQIGRYLEVHGPVYHRWVEWSRRVGSNPLLRVSLVPTLMQAARIDEMEQAPRLEAPIDQHFWEYAEWPFPWVMTSDEEQTRRNFQEAVQGWVEYLGWPTHPGVTWVEAALGLRREIYAVLSAPATSPPPAVAPHRSAGPEQQESHDVPTPPGFRQRFGVDQASKTVRFDGQ